MSKLEELVPPLELCKLIPKGEYEDSAFCWVDLREQFTISVNPYVTARELSNRDVSKIGIPAPTLQEIMADMPYCRVYKKTANFYVAVKEKDRVVSFNGATAALKLWLKLKGIDNESKI